MRIGSHRMLVGMFASALLVGACGDDGGSTTPDTTPGDTAGDTVFADVGNDTNVPDTTPDAIFPDTTVDTGTDTGADTGADTSADTSADTGVDTSTDTSTDTGADTGGDTSADTGADTSTDTGADTSTDTGADTIADTGADTSTDTGADTGTDTTADTDTIGPTAGESCTTPRVVTLPASWTNPVQVSGDTTTRADDHSVVASQCPGLEWAEGVGTADEVWALTAPSAGVYGITLTTTVADLGLYVLRDCPTTGAASCAEGSDLVGVGTEGRDIVHVELAAGATAYVVVDAYSDEVTPGESGAYTLAFEAPVGALPGDKCASAQNLVLDAGAYRGSGTTHPQSQMIDDLDGEVCGGDLEYGYGAGGKDQVWRFVAPTAGTWNVLVTPSDAADLMVYTFTGATCTGTCASLAIDAGIDGDPEQISLTLAANATVSIVVDTYNHLAGGDYSIAVSQCTPTCVAGECGMDDGCGGTCGCAFGLICGASGLCESEAAAGNTCDAPRPLSLATLEEGDLSAAGLSDDVWTGECELLAGGFPSDGVGTADEVWSFSVPTSGRYTIEALSDTGVDVFYMLYEDSSCSDAACVGYVDNGGEAEIDRFDHDLVAGKTYLLVIDTWSADSAGAYILYVDEACVAQCATGECGNDDGCGGTCGCGVGEVCDVDTCVDNVGDTCVAPYDIVPDEGGVFLELGDLSGELVGDDYGTEMCPLLDGYDSVGRGTPDEVFSFEITTAGTYAVEVLSDAGVDVFFALFEGDLCDTSSCLGQVDNGATEESDYWEFSLSPGRYNLLVDTYEAPSAGVYILSVTPVSVGNEACAEDLFISEYVEVGEGNNKALEIYNGTGAPVDLAGYQLWRANNGNTVAAGGDKFDLEKDAASASPVLAHGDTWVLCHVSSDAALKLGCDQEVPATSLLMNFNGDDYIALVKLGTSPTVVDAIGVEGTDPGSSWTVGEGSTMDHVLIRHPEILAGTANWTVGGAEWSTYSAATLNDAVSNSDLGFHDFFWQCPAP